MAYPDGFKYTKDHEWIDLTGDQGRVGITDYAQQQLGDVVYVELPEVGARVKQGQSFGTIESVKAVSELYSPVTGEIVEVNAALKDKPEGVNANPPNNASNSIGARRPSSDRAIHSSMVRTSAIGCSGSISATADRTSATTVRGSKRVLTISPMFGLACCVTG